FTLVGIAGEDDLDAPDTGPAHKVQADNGQDTSAVSNPVAINDGRQRRRKAGNGHWPRPLPRRSLLPASESAAKRDQLIADLGELASAEALTAWAAQHMGAKNALTAEDAQAVEVAFAVRLDDLTGLATKLTQAPAPSAVGVQNTASPVPVP